ncbi:protein SAR DEFICIENT 1-like [Rutidosis leptorrhynchoides]|uniref:protein SAR DEFICIENT 1-like n=1 Tax=Rutidosis leptorrhynchoides TaxID=125765 RepID=UPI003A98CFBD
MTKRLADQPDSDRYMHNERRRRARPSLASAIGEVVKMNFIQNFCTTLEPMLRKVVHQEVENGLRRRLLLPSYYATSNSMCMKELEPSTMQLKFRKNPTLPVFTGTKILDEDGNPLEIYLFDVIKNQECTIPCALKLQIVVVDGDFPLADNKIWTGDEFEKNIVKERRGKRPLLAGDLSVTMRDGVVFIGDIELTDNSSWIRSRKFRIAARVVQGATPGLVVREAMTEAFVVKDHRGELYKKHHPPMLEDEVWRLEKIGKDGAFHKKLAANDIKNVQDFLKLSVVSETKLRKILGLGMSDKMWDTTINHARKCVLQNKLYISRGPNHTIYLNPVCQVVKVVINGESFSGNNLSTVNKAYIQKFVVEAFRNWNSLEVIEGLENETLLLTQGDMADQYSSNNPRSCELALVSDQDHVGVVGSSYYYAPGEAYNFSESSPEDQLAAKYGFIK